ncbi:MAG: alpha/beta fold hydrolase [Acutalibacteraceae bacterium]|nr:alpha/beta hydrolase [Oscillospiraceae bacterium]
MDICLNYEEKGRGEPLILLHGNGEDHSYFIHQIEYFSRKFRVIAIDTRGHGASERGTGPFTIRRFADDLHYFMKEHEIKKANILGFSDGGNIALCFAIKYPESVNRLVIDGANLDTSGVKPYFQIPVEIGFKLASLFAGKSAGAKKTAEMLGLMVNDPDIDESALRAITAPTLVIAGTRDMIKREHTKKIAENIPDSRLLFIEGDHFIARKNAACFNAAVDKFLSEEQR